MRRSALLLLILLAGCGSSEEPAPPSEPTEAPTEAVTEAPPAETPEVPQPSGDGSSPAINSITVDPGDGTIMVGTGPALFRVDPGAKEGERIAGTVTTDKGTGAVSGNLVLRYTGPGDLLASGHPQGQSGLPENLPLIRSSDRGATWQAVPGTAEGDYHELESAGDTIVAVSVDAPDVLVSHDGGKTFASKTPPAPPIDVVIDPKNPQQWAVSTEQGTFISNNGGDSWRPRDTTFGARLTWPDALYSVDRNGKVRASTDGGKSWDERGDVGGIPSVIANGQKDELLVGIIGGKVQRSRDGGRKWTTAATLR